MSKRYILGIDNGGTNTKAAIYDMSGKELAVSSRGTKMLTPRPFFTERSIPELIEATIEVIKNAINKSGVDPEAIVGVSCTGHGNGLYLMGEEFTPVRNGIISTDSRAIDYIDKWYQEKGFEEKIHPLTMSSVWAGQPVALLAWLKDNEPKMIDRTKYIFMVKDLVRYYLTGKATLEITDISGTNLINLKTKNYDDDIFDFFDILDWKDKLPPLVNSTEEAGKISKKMAELTGLVEGTPVAGGVFDIASSAVATGLVNDNQLAIVTGTWSINEYITSEPKAEADLFMTSIYPIEDKWLVTEASPTSASNLEWFINTFLANQPITTGQSIYDYCNDLVCDTTVDEGQLLFFPFIFGSNSIADATSGFVGINSYHELKHFVRAIYEGVIFSHMYHIEKLRTFNLNLEGAARIAGGITNSDVWLQMFSDALGIPLEIVTVKESGTLGTAM
ncbi:MAG: FGGY-family carbohydrate kinase, partial [Vagococcus sp.]